MARLAYADINDPDCRDLVRQIVAQRGEVPHLYRMLLHSAPIAEGWLGLMTAVRQRTTLPGALRELMIIRIALLNGAPYEAEQHIPIAIAEGARQEQIDGLNDWSGRSERYDEKERAALALTDRMTREVQVDDETWRAVREQWCDREIVELVTTIAAYNMVSRFLEAFEIRSNDAT